MNDLAKLLETLLDEVRANPKKSTVSTMRTIDQAKELLSVTGTNVVPHSPRIAIVDDDVFSHEVISLALERAGLDAVAFEDPLLALQAMHKKAFDLVFLDVEMPGMRGFEMCPDSARDAGVRRDSGGLRDRAAGFRDACGRETGLGETDFIAKPVVLCEVAVKAVLHLTRRFTALTANSFANAPVACDSTACAAAE